MNKSSAAESEEMMSKLIRDVMTKNVSLFDPELSVAKAAVAMRDEDIGALPVAKNDKLVGVLTDRDIVVRTVAKGLDPQSTKVRDVMSDGIFYCFDDQDCKEVAQNFGENQIRRLPVVNRDKELVGIVSLGDLAIHGPDKSVGEALEEISKPAN